MKSGVVFMGVDLATKPTRVVFSVWQGCELVEMGGKEILDKYILIPHQGETAAGRSRKQ